MLHPDELMEDGVCGLNESLGPSIREASAALLTPEPVAPADLLPASHDDECWRSAAVISAGDPLFPGIASVRSAGADAEQRARQLGAGGEVVACVPLPDPGADGRGRVLLTVNHFPLPAAAPVRPAAGLSPASQDASGIASEMAACGLSVVELGHAEAGGWRAHRGSPFNRRLTAKTWIELSGPAAGHPWLSTFYDPTGLRVRGTLGNQAGGRTAWGTVLSGEAGFAEFFAHAGTLPVDDPRRAAHERFGLPSGPGPRRWESMEERFHAAHEPNEAFRFGWIVEVDPYDPNSTPHKRTALGRLRHAAVAPCVSRDGRVVVYLADGAPGGCFYKFVSGGRYHCRERQANLPLLDEGELRVAVFHADGSGEWRTLEHGRGPLTESHRFPGQADVLVDAPRAAALLGGTRWGRPGCVQINPATGRVLACAGPPNLRLDAFANDHTAAESAVMLHLGERRNDAAAVSFTWEPVAPPGAPGRVTQFTFDQTGNAWFVGTDATGRPAVSVLAMSDERSPFGRAVAVPLEGGGGRVEFSPDYQTAFHVARDMADVRSTVVATCRARGGLLLNGDGCGPVS